jgi:hypothetical protein
MSQKYPLLSSAWICSREAITPEVYVKQFHGSVKKLRAPLRIYFACNNDEAVARVLYASHESYTSRAGGVAPMSPRGQVGNGKRRLGCTEAERAFTDALLAVYGQLRPRTQADVAEELFCSASAMSQYFNLQRSVPVAFVKALYRVALEAVGDVSAMPLRLDELLALHDEAGREAWSRKNGSVPGPRKSADLLSATEAPVLHGHADRRSAVGAEASWDGIDDVLQLLEAGLPEDAARLLDHAGSSLSAKEVQSSAASCRSIGFDDGAEAVLRSASRRGAEHVVDVVRELTRAGQHIDIAVLLLGGDDVVADGDSASSGDNSTLNGTSIHGATRALDTEADLMMANSEPDQDAAGSRLEPAAAGPFRSSAGAAESGDRRYVFLPRQREKPDGCDAGPIVVDPMTGDCECPECGTEGMKWPEDLYGETDDAGMVDPPRCPDQANHIYCTDCGRWFRPV